MRVLPERIAARQGNNQFYKKALGHLDGLSFMPVASYGEPNYWLTCITIDPEKFGATREEIRLALERENIEARPLWKPLHLQPVFAGCEVVGGQVSEELFATGLCLPSGSNLRSEDLERTATIVSALHGRR